MHGLAWEREGGPDGWGEWRRGCIANLVVKAALVGDVDVVRPLCESGG
jgi:hypothetical protein